MHVPPQTIISSARAAQGLTGLWTSVQLAQWADESGWGERMPEGSNNPFGIKARCNAHGMPMEAAVKADTEEWSVTLRTMVPAECWFAKYPTITEAFVHHAKLLTQGAPYADAMKVISNLPLFVAKMASHYATDPLYASKLMAIITDDKLRQYDLPNGARTPA